jgi:predicted thioesterase
MQAIPPNLSNRIAFTPEERHTASALGNVGVHVVSTPALIGFLELACHQSILPHCDPGEASVGTRVEVDHLAAAFLGTPIIAESRVTAVEGRRIVFEVVARQGDRVVMRGRHGRAVVVLERLLALGARAP